MTESGFQFILRLAYCYWCYSSKRTCKHALHTTIQGKESNFAGTKNIREQRARFAMALSNPLSPVEKRLPGYVGLPLPSVEVKIVSEETGWSHYCKTNSGEWRIACKRSYRLY